MKHSAIALKMAWAKQNKVGGVHTIIADIRNFLVRDKEGAVDIDKTVKNIVDHSDKVPVYHSNQIGNISFGKEYGARANAQPVSGGFKGLKNVLK
jgi:hypothetical protein